MFLRVSFHHTVNHEICIHSFSDLELNCKGHVKKLVSAHEGNTMRKIMGNKPQVSSAIIIHSLYQGQTADGFYN
jgi:hypothetical protein